MHEMRVRLLPSGLLRAAFIAFGLAASSAVAEPAWPERTVKVVTNFAAGSSQDTVARLLADGLAKLWSKPVIVENRPGAEGSIGVADFVSANDDHALLFTVTGVITVTPRIIDKPGYDPDRDLIPIVATSATAVALAVHTHFPPLTLADVVPLLGAHPGEYSWAAGPTVPRYIFATFLKRQGLTMNYVGYRDAATPQTDLGEGRIQLLVSSVQATMAPVLAGKARYLAVASSARVPAIAHVPTVAEAGFPELTIDGLSGLFGARGLQAERRDRIVQDVNRVISYPVFRAKLEATGQAVLGGSSAEFERRIAEQRRKIDEFAAIIDLRRGQ